MQGLNMGGLKQQVVFVNENNEEVNLADMFTDSSNDWVGEIKSCPKCGGYYITDNAGQNECLECGYKEEK